MELLTASRASAYKRCPRRHFYAYELRMRPTADASALTFGSLYHAFLARISLDPDAQTVLDHVPTPEGMDPYHYAAAVQLWRGYSTYYGHSTGLAVLGTETPFSFPLRNPATGAASRNWQLAGKIDAYGSDGNGRTVLVEYKTTSSDISPASEYWRWLRADPQISLYVLALRDAGHDCGVVVYDVTRKPKLDPRNVPMLDADGLKVFRDESGNRALNKNGSPRQSPGTGLTLDSRPETVDEFSARLAGDIAAAPEDYFARREVPMLDDQLDEYQHELWQSAHAITEAQRFGRWFRNVDPMLCRWCPYSQLCLDNVRVDPATPPAGFEVVAEAHPELAE